MFSLEIIDGCFIISFLVFAFAVVLASSTNEHLFHGKYGPKEGKRLNRVTLLVWVFIALAIYNLGVYLTVHQNALAHLRDSFIAKDLSSIFYYLARVFCAVCDIFFDSLQMMLADAPITTFNPNTSVFFDIYSHIVFVIAPVTTIFFVIDQLSEFFAKQRMLLRHKNHKRVNTYVISPLNERAIILARSIKEHHVQVEQKDGFKLNIVFTDVQNNGDASLAEKARADGATVLKQSLDSVLRELPVAMPSKEVRVILDSDNEGWNVAKARSLVNSEDIAKRVSKVCFVSNPYGSSAEIATDIKDSKLRRIDWTLNLVEKTLKDYPTFFLSLPPEEMGDAYKNWQNHMYDTSERHVIVVGAGHVGLEFLRRAMSSSRIYGLSFTFDVFDKIPGDVADGECNAKQRLRAIAPELLFKDKLNRDFNMHKVRFHTCDVRGDYYTWFIKQHSRTITYVFIALGDDMLTSEIAQRTRVVLNRGIVNDCVQRGGDLEDCDRAIIAAVIDDEQLAKLIEDRWEGLSKVVSVGSSSDMYTYDMMINNQDPDKEYYDMSTRASKDHAKYRLFAYERLLNTGSKRVQVTGTKGLSIVWGKHFIDESTKVKTDTYKAISDYEYYLLYRKRKANNEIPDYKWLLRMEHARWSTYMRAEGYCCVPESQIATYYALAKKSNYKNKSADSGHRYDEALIHACLVPFGELDGVLQEVNRVRSSEGEEEIEPFWNNDDAKLHIHMTATTRDVPDPCPKQWYRRILARARAIRVRICHV